MTLLDKWDHYRDTRRGTYEFRARTRYKSVADRLFSMGLKDGHTIMDVGAGTCQFGRYLRQRDWDVCYIPVDAVIDGTDLEQWVPRTRADFVVCIEVLEHLHTSLQMLRTLVNIARRGVVLTTPNCETVDVFACDSTHVSVITPTDLIRKGFTVERHTWFGTPDDSLLAYTFRCPTFWRLHA